MAGAVSPIVRFSPTVRRRGTTVEQFVEHWRTTHAEVVLGLAGLGGYVQNHPVLEDGVPVLGWASVDGCAEIEFPDVETMDAAMGSDYSKAHVVPDARLFLEPDRGGLALTERRVFRDGCPPEHGVKLLTLLRRHPLCDETTFLAALGEYAEAAGGAAALRHEQLVPIAGLYADGPAPVCDAVDLLWFETAGEAAAFPRSAAARDAAAAAAGRVLGVERVVARPFRVL